jgi:cytochrome c biogenesis protein CcdA
MIGISFSNVGICILMAAGCAGEHSTAGKYFIFGRAVGLIALGLIIMIFGIVVEGLVLFFIVAFGVLSVILGTMMLYEAISGRRINVLESITFVFRRNRKSRRKTMGIVKCGNLEGKQGRPAHKSSCVQAGKGYPKGIAKPRLKGTGTGQEKCGKRKNRFLLLGMFRGVTPCLKIMVLAPLLVSSMSDHQYFLAVGMLLVFVASSSVYPIMGFLGMSLFDNFREYGKYVKVAGALLIMVLGIYVVANHYMKLGAGG